MYCKLKTGDLLYRGKGLVQHTGVYIDDNKVLHNTPKKGIKITSYTDYANGCDVEVISTDIRNKGSFTTRLQELISSKRGYNFALNNCEHTATYLVYDRRTSPQVKAAAVGAVIGSVLGQKKATNTQVLMAVFGGMIGCYLSNEFRKYNDRSD